MSNLARLQRQLKKKLRQLEDLGVSPLSLPTVSRHPLGSAKKIREAFFNALRPCMPLSEWAGKQLPNRTFSLTATATALGISKSLVSDMIRRGCPVDRRFNRGDYWVRVDPVEVAFWLKYRPDRKMKMLLNRSALAKRLGLHRNVVKRLINLGAPMIGKLADPIEFAKWYKEFKANEPKRRRFATGTAHDPRPGIIYSLTDPRTGQVRYIGKTGKKLSTRVTAHLRDAKRGKSHLHRWLRNLVDVGLRPDAKVVQECLPGMLDACEQEWIAKGRAKGWNLTNSTDGGEQFGTMSKDVCERIADISREAWKRPEYQERHKAARAKLEQRRAQERGMTVDEYRVWRVNRLTEAELKRRSENMRIQAERVRQAEDRKRWVRVPLTYHGAAFVHLTNGKCAMVNIGDWERVSKYCWWAQRGENDGRTYWHARTKKIKAKGLGSPMRLHRFVVDADSRHVACNRGHCR